MSLALIFLITYLCFFIHLKSIFLVIFWKEVGYISAVIYYN